MKKSLIYSMILATALFCSCKGDYDDWAKPQHNDQQETISFGDGSISELGSVINLKGAGESVKVVGDIKAPTSNNEAYATPSYELNIGDKALAMSTEGTVATSELQDYIVDAYGKQPTERDIKATVSAWIGNANTKIKTATSGELSIKVIPDAADIDTKGYYIIGDKWGWTKADAQKLNHSDDNNVYDDPAFTITVQSTKDKTFKIISASAIEGLANDANLKDNAEAYGITDGKLAKGGEAIKFTEDGKTIVNINMETLECKLEKGPSDLFLTGSKYGWGNTADGGSWKQLTPVNGSFDDFWTIIYLEKDEQFKFAPQAGWGNDFGYIGADKIKDEAGAGISDAGGNLTIKNAGWYLIYVNNGNTRSIQILKPEVYVFGTAAGGKWDFDSALKCTTPTTKDGQFVTPSLFATKADEDDGLRLCVKVGNFDWWKTEFIIRDGKIEYRGRGGDQKPRVKVQDGQKAYLNFAKGTGEIK